MKKFLILSIALSFLTSCMMGQTAGVMRLGGGNYKVECSPLESGVCQKKAQKTCQSQGKKIKVLSSKTVKKYGRSSIETNAAGFEIQEFTPYERAEKVQVLEARFTCVS